MIPPDNPKDPPETDSAGLSGTAARLGTSAGRLATRPARALLRGGAERLEQAATDVLSAPEVGRVVDGALAGPLPEEIARSLAEHHVLERVVAELLASIDLEATVAKALDDERAEQVGRQLVASPVFERIVGDAVEVVVQREILNRALSSPDFQRALGQVLASPEIRSALTGQTKGLGEEMAAGVRARGAVLDEASERRMRRWLRRRPATEAPPPGPAAFGGLPTRAVAFVLDLVLAQLGFLVLAASLGLVASLVGTLRPVWLVDLLVGVGWGLFVGGYFVLFWTTTGQTPGLRLMRLRVEREGDPPGFGRSLVRLVGILLSIVPLFAGFLPVLFDDRRRGLADFLAGTVVRREDDRATGD